MTLMPGARFNLSQGLKEGLDFSEGGRTQETLGRCVSGLCHTCENQYYTGSGRLQCDKDAAEKKKTKQKMGAEIKHVTGCT